MAQINVNRKVHDQFYRYKMPRIIGKVEGRGNGIKTVLANVVDVAKALNVPPDYPTKYLSIELGAQVILDLKNDKFIINGAHIDKKLQSLVYDFIERYLICSVCQNPETVLSVTKERIRQDCQACGNAAFVSTPHRFNTYILKHPPKSTAPEQSSRKMEQISVSNNYISNADETPENLDWSMDVTDVAVQQRMLELTNKAAELIFHKDLEKSIPERLKIFSKKANQIISPWLSNSSTNCSQDFEDLLHEAKRLDVIDEAIIIISELIFDSDKVFERIKQFCILISMFVKSQKAEANLISSIELVVAKYSEILVSKISSIFFCLYEFELVHEFTFMQWSAKKSKRYLGNTKLVDSVHKAANSFINWLKTADEESSEGSDEIEFENPAKESEFNSASRYAIPAVINDDDLNIDDI